MFHGVLMRMVYERLEDHERKLYRSYGGDEVVASAHDLSYILDYDTTIIDGNVPATCQKEIDTLKELTFMKLGVKPEDFMTKYEFKTYDEVWYELDVEPRWYLDTE